MIKTLSALPVRRYLRSCCLLTAVSVAGLVGFADSNLVAQTGSRAEAEFYKGYYLQHEQKDLKNALKAYESALSQNADQRTRSAIESEMLVLNEEIATADFAQIMPADAFGYVEISNPARHVEQLAKLMGLTGRKFGPDSERTVIQIEDGLSIGSDFQISPALLREMKKIRGAAIAVTDIGRNGKPGGLAVVHPGDSDLVKGLVDTGIQFVPSEKRIEGFPTFQVENEIWIVKTNRLILISTEQSQIKQALARISDSSQPCLKHQEKFQLARRAQADPAMFAFVEPEKLLPILRASNSQEVAIASMLLDINHMNYVSLSVTSTDQGLQTDFDVDFSENHNSIAYGLVRTVPLSKKALSHVPMGSVGVVGMGVNPQLLTAAEMAGANQLTGLDIGREFFANIRELGLFVLPTARREIPDFGLVIAASDVEKSQRLWNTVLSLPSQMGMPEGPQSDVIEIAGVKARVYDFRIDEEIPPIVIARLNDDSLIAGTHHAVETAIVAGKNGQTLANDPQAQALWDSTSEHTAKAVFIHVGRALQMAAAMSGGRDAEEMRAVSRVIEDLKFTLVIDEAPANFSATLNATGLPMFENIIKTVAGMQGTQRSPSDRAPRYSAERVISTEVSDVEIRVEDE